MSVVSVKVKLLGDKNIKLPKHLDNEENRQLIPVLRRHNVTIHMKKTSAAVVNAIRRTLMCEMNIKVLEIDKDDIDTDDTNIMWASLQKSIQAIRLNQEVPANTRFKLDYKNDTIEPQMIRTRDLTTDHKLDNIIPFNPTFRIITVREGTYLKMKNIRVVVGKGKIYGQGMYTAIYGGGGPVPLDVEQYERGEGESSFVSNPTEFTMTFGTCGTASPKWLLMTACQSIYERAIVLLKELELVDTKKGMKHLSDVMDIYQKGDVTHFKIKDETNTICNLVRYFIYQKHKDIPLINYDIPHPTEDVAIIKLDSQNPKSVMMAALETIVELYKKLETQFDEKTS
jgi:DNA-directed RNA polymerase subunit L